ncbi:MAG: PEP-CTERM system histidine kinase PrsK [Burkholderiales bacterium]|nr:PEP-CTERM system histidine kinase PrsK [Burkholderiales bacterium]
MTGDTGGLTVGLAQVSFALVAATYALYGAWLLRGRRDEAAARAPAHALLAAVLGTVAWSLASLVDMASTKMLGWHLAWCFDQWRYAAWACFILALLPPAAGGRTGLAPGLQLRGPLGLVLLLAAAGLGANLYLGFVSEASALALRALVATQLAWAVLGLVLVEQLFRNQAEASRWSVKPLCLGLGLVFAYDVYLFAQALMFNGFDGDALGARGLVHALALPLLWLAARRRAHVPARLQVSQAAAFYSASLMLVGMYLLFMAGAGYYVRFFGGSWGGALQVALLAIAMAMLAALLASGTLRARLRVLLNKHFFSYRYDYRIEWLRFTAMLSTRAAPQEVGELVVRGLANMVECTAGLLWFRSLGDDAFVPAAAWNLPPQTQAEPLGSPLALLMHQREWIVDLGAVRRGRGAPEETAAAPAWLLQLPGAWSVVPLLAADEMLGFVVLAKPRTPIELDWEVRDLLKTAARQAAGFMAQMHATEALLEARKFDAFNRMSAFVVHDLKNIVTQLSLMLKNAQRHGDNPEFQQDMLSTVESSLDKMRQLMLQLREGERPPGVASGVELAPILQRIGAAAQQRGRELALTIHDRVATRGHEQRLERVLGHVVQNALDATAASGAVRVTLQQQAGRAVVVVRDTGVGMSPEFVRNQLFRPFASTKANGMGIGSYESFQYLRELGGSIDVSSAVGVGTEVTLAMPLFDKRTGSDLRAEGAAQGTL